MRTTVIANQKGRVGKTTSTLNIGAGLTQLGKKVLLVDLDPQAHLTYSMGIPPHELSRTVYQVPRGEITVEDVILDKDGVKLVPSTLNLRLRHNQRSPLGQGFVWAKNGHKHALRSNAVKNHPSSWTVIEWRVIGLKSVNALN
jgi:cellulose biosynthesis protein BcsQ